MSPKKLLPLLVLALAIPVSFAQAPWPNRPVTIVVPFPPGGGTDTGARIVAEQLSRKWGQPVLVDNKGGAAGQLGADFVAKAKPDGYTIIPSCPTTLTRHLRPSRSLRSCRSP